MATKTSVLTLEKDLQFLIVDFTCDAAYPTGGYTFLPTTVGMREILAVDIVGNTPGIIASYAAGKLKLIGSTISGAQKAGTELAANSTEISATTVLRLLVIGH